MQAEAINLGLPKSKHTSKKVTLVQTQASFFAGWGHQDKTESCPDTGGWPKYFVTECSHFIWKLWTWQQRKGHNDFDPDSQTGHGFWAEPSRLWDGWREPIRCRVWYTPSYTVRRPNFLICLRIHYFVHAVALCTCKTLPTPWSHAARVAQNYTLWPARSRALCDPSLRNGLQCNLCSFEIHLFIIWKSSRTWICWYGHFLPIPKDIIMSLQPQRKGLRQNQLKVHLINMEPFRDYSFLISFLTSSGWIVHY